MQEKIRRTDKIEVDMAVVKNLQYHQNEINHYMKKDGSSQRCNLYPKADLYPCNVCSRLKLCIKHKKERDYIKSNSDSFCTSKRRGKKEEKKELQSKTLKSHGEVKETYPCEPFDFCCPEKGKCNKGKNCPF